MTEEINAVKLDGLWTRAHELKCWPPYFQATRTGDKLFEYRKNDRDFTVGEVLILREWDPVHETYTPSERLFMRITYVLRASAGFGLPEDYCVMSIAPVVGEITDEGRTCR